MINCCAPKKQVKSLILPSNLLLTGLIKEKLNVLEQKVDIEDSFSHHSCLYPLKILNQQKEISATVESLPSRKKKIWKDKLPISEINIQTTKLLKILDQELISKEKVLTPFWTQQSKVISEKLWLPTKIDCVDSVLNSSKESLKNNLMGKSWFSINLKHPQNKNSLMTSFQLSQFSLPDSMDSEVINLKSKSKKKQEGKKLLKTLKFRIFPSDEEKDKLQLLLDQYRWYYNSSVDIFYDYYGFKNILSRNKYFYSEFRDVMRTYKYTETKTDDGFIIKQYIKDENSNETMQPEWWKNNVHSRVPRGACEKFIYNINSAISNYKNGHINKFEMKYRTKRNNTDYLHFEDSAYPSFINKIKSRYWYRTKKGKRKTISFESIKNKKGIEIIYEKKTNKYFLHCPVDINWIPNDDKRNDSQVKFSSNKEERIISLDPGVRKFLVGYDPTGKSVFIGEGANKLLMNLLYQIDDMESKKQDTFLIWKKIKNMINELHWKTVSFLISNYDTIIIPDFKVSEMVRKKKLTRMTKRLMLMYSFYSFKEKLKWKCCMYNKRMIIVDESFTSCTCGICGTINRVQGKEIFKCSNCNYQVDRDVTGSRNILIKNIKLKIIDEDVEDT